MYIYQKNTHNTTYLFFHFQGIYILLLPYDCLVNLYLHVISATLMILAEIMSRVYVEEELALFESPAKQQMIGTSSYYKRQVYELFKSIRKKLSTKISFVTGDTSVFLEQPSNKNPFSIIKWWVIKCRQLQATVFIHPCPLSETQY